MRRLLLGTLVAMVPAGATAESFSIELNVGLDNEWCCEDHARVVIKKVYRWHRLPCGRRVRQCRRVYRTCYGGEYWYGPWQVVVGSCNHRCSYGCRYEKSCYSCGHGHACRAPAKRVHRYTSSCGGSCTVTMPSRHTPPRRVYRSATHTKPGPPVHTPPRTIKRRSVRPGPSGLQKKSGGSLQKTISRKPDAGNSTHSRVSRSRELTEAGKRYPAGGNAKTRSSRSSKVTVRRAYK